jgi:hypothetical protein
MRFLQACLEVDDRHFDPVVRKEVNQPAPKVAADVSGIPDQRLAGAQRAFCALTCSGDDWTVVSLAQDEPIRGRTGRSRD